jgi:hypothetical protein
MRWGAAILAVMAVSVLAGCGGGGSGSTEEINSGDPPGIPTKIERPLIERQIAKHNAVSLLDCHKATGKPDDSTLNLWNCAIRLKKYENDTGEIQIVAGGGNGRYAISECTFATITPASEKSVPNICKLIH